MNGYAELQVTTNYSFLRGGSHASELVYTAASLGTAAIGVTDHNTLAGVVKAHAAAREFGIKVLVGCRVDLEAEQRSLLCFPQDKPAYSRLVRLLTLGKGRGGKGLCSLWYDDLKKHGAGQIVIELADVATDALRDRLIDLKQDFPGRCYLALTRRYQPDEEMRLFRLDELAHVVGVPTVATNDIHYHVDSRRILHDVVTCIRQGVTVDELGQQREVSSDRYIKPPEEMYRLFRGYENAVARTIEIANRCTFSLDEVQYQYPDEHFFDGRSAQEALIHLTDEGAAKRYPHGVPEKVSRQIEHEMQLITQLKYAPYFLTVWRIVDFARSQGILCQGRGSAANSAVCFCLGITSIDPAFTDLLFERFISVDRNEPPDIDVDFEHERREEVIQWIYQTYGRERAALAATVVHYRSKRAVREVGKALGLSEDVTASLAKSVWGWGNEGIPQEQVKALGLDPTEYRLAMTLQVTEELIGFPRHLSQHPGGFVIARDRLDDLVPIEPASMEDRSIVEWDKDDLDALKMLKIDILALGMLSCIRKSFDYLHNVKGITVDIASVPAEDSSVYDMICEADTVGVFQIESRAQMSMLPRLRPRTFYDLVIECAIVRPGPIQGNMVHPYLRRRQGIEKVVYPSKELEGVLGKTLGVPLFQEQAMKIAIVAAGFTPGEADQLRRAMGSFRSRGAIATLRQRFISGMVTRGYQPEFAERCFSQIEGFGTYGFPESHSASFAILIYVSCWIKHHHPEIFLCAILNSQPMGFYAPAQLVRDARNHKVVVLPIDVNVSRWDCALEPTEIGLAVRIGFRYVKGFSEDASARIVTARYEPYVSIEDIVRRSGASEAQLELLADGDAFACLGLDRHKASWTIKGLRSKQLPLFAAADIREAQHFPELLEPTVNLPVLSEGGECLQDYQTVSFSLRKHPLHFVRDQLAAQNWSPLSTVSNGRDGQKVRIAGLVLVRQRPGSAKGVTFITLEDETANANLVMWPALFEKFRSTVMTAGMLGCVGRIQREGSVIHVVVESLENLSSLLRQIGRDGETEISPYARADEGSRSSGGRDSRDPKEEAPPTPPRTMWKHPREVNVIGELEDPRKMQLAKVRNFH